MLRILIVATLLLLVSATGARADAMAASGAVSGATTGEGIAIQLQIGAGMGAHAFLQPAVRASVPSEVMQRSINGSRQAQGTAERRSPMLSLSVSDSVSLGLRYRYLRPEDLRREAAETASLNEDYSSHNLLVRARWQF
jgi:opacity protein-like surface antigen